MDSPLKYALPAMLGLAACAGAVAPSPPSAAPGTGTPVRIEAPFESYSSADPILLLLNTPETFDVLQKHIPFFVNLTEHGLLPPFPTDKPLDDLLDVHEARVTPANIAAINAELAKIPRLD
jgi:hypothetical protein